MKKITILSLLIGCAITLIAQNNNSFNESVVIRGTYKPSIGQHEKLTFPSVITDTAVHINHNFKYDITTKRLNSTYQPTRIKAARLIGEPSTKLYNNYFRLGFGNHWTPLFDAYWSSTRDKHKTYGVRLNHLSSWGEIDNYGTNQVGQNDIVAFGKFIIKEKVQLSTDIDYSHDHNLYYGFTDSLLGARMNVARDDISLTDYRAKYNIVRWNIGVKNLQLDSRKIGYDVSLGLYDLWASYGQNTMHGGLDGTVRYPFLNNSTATGTIFLNLKGDVDINRQKMLDVKDAPMGYKPENATDSINGTNYLLHANPYADIDFSNMHLHLGLTGVVDGNGEDNPFRVLPDVVLNQSTLGGRVVFSVGATGEVEANNIDRLRLVNPYIKPFAEQRTSRHYDFTGSMRWDISRKMEARIGIEYSLLRDDLNFIIDTNYCLENVYASKYVDYNRFTLGGEVNFINDEMLTIKASGHYYSYEAVQNNDTVFYRPTWDALLTARVNYKNKWLFSLTTSLLGRMRTDIGTSLPVRFGVDAELEYRHNRALSFFLRMDNLAFQRYYYWRNYPSYRGIFILGLTYTIPK